MVLTPATLSALTAASTLAMPSLEPDSTRPLGNIWFAMVTSSGMTSASASSSNPMTVIMPDGARSQAAPMASPRSFRSVSAVSSSMTPANVSAEYSPSEKPAVTLQRATASGSSFSSFLTAAMDVRKTQTWE